MHRASCGVMNHNWILLLCHSKLQVCFGRISVSLLLQLQKHETKGETERIQKDFLIWSRWEKAPRTTLVVWEHCSWTESFVRGSFFFGTFSNQLWNLSGRHSVIRPWSRPTPGRRLWIMSSTSSGLGTSLTLIEGSVLHHISNQRWKWLLSWDFDF